MSELISKDAALDCFRDWIDRYGHEHTADEDPVYQSIAELPAVQPDRDVIDDCLYHIYKNISTHTATGGVIAIRYYMEKLYEEIYVEGEKPWWMK